MKGFAPIHFFHWLEPQNMWLVEKHGLLSTERLLALAEMPKKESKALLTKQRIGSLALPNGAIVRDQSPMPPNALAKVLPAGMAPSNWYRLLNGYVFLWADLDRANRHRHAFRNRAVILLTFDAQRILKERGGEVFLSPINSGNAMRKAAPRSAALFTPYRTWLSDGWPEINGYKRPKSHKPAEIVIEDHLPLQPFLLETRLHEASGDAK